VAEGVASDGVILADGEASSGVGVGTIVVVGESCADSDASGGASSTSGSSPGTVNVQNNPLLS